MTDISNWRDAIHFHETKRLMVPLNSYQIGHIVGAMWEMKKAGKINGDWYGETLDIMAAAMKFAGIDAVWTNHGLSFTQEQVLNRLSDYTETQADNFIRTPTQYER